MSLGKQDLVLPPDEALHENQNRRLLDSSYDFTYSQKKALDIYVIIHCKH